MNFIWRAVNSPSDFRKRRISVCILSWLPLPFGHKVPLISDVESVCPSAWRNISNKHYIYFHTKLFLSITQHHPDCLNFIIYTIVTCSETPSWYWSGKYVKEKNGNPVFQGVVLILVKDSLWGWLIFQWRGTLVQEANMTKIQTTNKIQTFLIANLFICLFTKTLEITINAINAYSLPQNIE